MTSAKGATAVGDAYDRCRTGSTAGRGSIAGWTPCPLCSSSLQHDPAFFQPGSEGCRATVIGHDSIVQIMSNLPQTTKSMKLFSHGRGLAAHLHAVHTPWNPGKAERKRRRALRKRLENERRRLQRLRNNERDGILDGNGGGGQERSAKRPKLVHHTTVENDNDAGTGSDFVARDKWEPTESEIEHWNQRVMEIVALVESESKKKERAACCPGDAIKEEGTATDSSQQYRGESKGRDRSGNVCLSYRESLPPFLAGAADGDLGTLQRCVAGGKEALNATMFEDGNKRQAIDPDTLERAKSLLSLRDRNGSTAEHWAAGSGHLDCMAYLLELRDMIDDAPADAADTRTFTKVADDVAHTSKKVRRRRDGKTALHYAARNGHNDIIDLILSRDDAPHVDVPSGDGTTPLHLACYGGHPATIRNLVETHRADVLATNEWECGAAHWSAMSLGSAGTEKVIELCVYLKERGVDFSMRQKQGHAPLHKAASRKNRHVIEWLASTFSREERNAMGMPDVGGNRPSDIWMSAGGDGQFGRRMKDTFGW